MSEHTCPICKAPEVEADSPRTVYACGSSDYDQRLSTFIRSESCRVSIDMSEMINKQVAELTRQMSQAVEAGAEAALVAILRQKGYRVIEPEAPIKAQTLKAGSVPEKIEVGMVLTWGDPSSVRYITRIEEGLAYGNNGIPGSDWAIAHVDREKRIGPPLVLVEDFTSRT